ncbi:MAG: sodium:calcium antiporter, partial [Myxococcota bacterium]|nr:sodium:calcium antiporter [Myxococcota bacterium]
TWGADLLIDGASSVARVFGVSERVIGLTLVALGTSLPELASSLVAALKGEAELLMGNIFGSNIFNVLAVGGAMGMARADVSTDFTGVHTDLMVMVGFAVVIGLMLAPIGARNTVQRIEGAVLVLCYGLYIGMLGTAG